MDEKTLTIKISEISGYKINLRPFSLLRDRRWNVIDGRFPQSLRLANIVLVFGFEFPDDETHKEDDAKRAKQHFGSYIGIQRADISGVGVPGLNGGGFVHRAMSLIGGAIYKS